MLDQSRRIGIQGGYEKSAPLFLLYNLPVFQLGIDRLLEDPSPIAGRGVALLTHPAGVTSGLL